MARFDVFRNRDGGGYLLDVQNDILDHLNVRVVVPLMRPDAAPKPADRLNPVFEIEGKKHIMVTQYISAVPESELGRLAMTLRADDYIVTQALDMLFQGF
jgi:toxin CcdB